MKSFKTKKETHVEAEARRRVTLSRRRAIQLGGLGIAASIWPELKGADAVTAQTPTAAQASKRPFERKLPYPRSNHIRGLEYIDQPSKYPGTNSDVHNWTWGADDAIWVVDQDGKNFGLKYNYADGTWTWSELLRVTGVPPNHRVEFVYGFERLGLRGPYPNLPVRWMGGTVAVGSRLYVAIADYAETIPGRDQWFVNSLALSYGVLGIVVSEDGGKTWGNIPERHGAEFLGSRFTNIQFVTFGPGYTKVPPPLKGYIYAISSDFSWETGDHLFLARVPQERILDRRAWQFYSGAGEGHSPADPSWTDDEEKATPIFTDVGHTGLSDMIYNHGLRKFLLSVFSDVVPHTLDTPTNVAKKVWDLHTEMQIYEGPSPWGPWRLVYDERPWGGSDHTAYEPHIPAKWLSEDGLTGALLFSGDWVFHDKQWYGFMTQRFQLVL